MPDPTLRETLESAVATVETGAPSPAPAPIEPSAPSPAPAPVQPDATFKEGEQAPKVNDGGQPRGPDGKFAPKEGTATPKEGAPTPAPAPAPAPQNPADAAAAAKKLADEANTAAQRAAVRAPQSLKPAEREAFAKADPALQEAFVRRDREVQQVLQQTAGARQFTQRMTEVLNPYIPLIQANGGDPFRYVGNLLNASNALTHGAPQFKAQVVAELVKQFGVDIEMLDTALAGLPVPDAAAAPAAQIMPQVQQLVQQQLAPVQQLLGQINAQRQAAYQQSFQQETQSLEQFAADPKNEFFEDVRETMADLIELAAGRGIDLSYADAYSQACQLHPDVRSVIMSRNSNAQAQNAAQQLTQAAQRARSAAVSVSGSPAFGVPGNAPADSKALSIRASIEQAIAAQAG